MSTITPSEQTKRNIQEFAEACAQVEAFMKANGLSGRIDHKFMGTTDYQNRSDFRIPSREINLALDSAQDLAIWDEVSRPFQLRCYNGVRGHPTALPITDDEQYLLMWNSAALDLIGGQKPGATEPAPVGWTLYVRYWPNGRTVFQYPPADKDLLPGRKNSFTLPLRNGTKPDTTATVPHLQCTDVSPLAIREELKNWIATDPFFQVRKISPSEVAEPTSIAFFVGDRKNVHGGYGMGPVPRESGYEAFHIHEDGGGHVSLSPEDRWELIVKHWGEPHPGCRWGMHVMLFYAPRNKEELEIVKTILKASYRYAMGEIVA